MKKLLLLILLVSFIFSGCTAQERAKHLGGTYSVDLPEGQKLVNVTWKEDTLWYLTKPMSESDAAEVYTFQADSSWGLVEGTVIIKESK